MVERTACRGGGERAPDVCGPCGCLGHSLSGGPGRVPRCSRGRGPGLHDARPAPLSCFCPPPLHRDFPRQRVPVLPFVTPVVAFLQVATRRPTRTNNHDFLDVQTPSDSSPRALRPERERGAHAPCPSQHLRPGPGVGGTLPSPSGCAPCAKSLPLLQPHCWLYSRCLCTRRLPREMVMPQG